MNTVKEFVDKVSASSIADAVGCGTTAVFNAVSKGKFPTSWYPTVKKVGQEAGIDVPLCLFSWKSQQHAEQIDASEGSAA